jgi:hypothetical protein
MRVSRRASVLAVMLLALLAISGCAQATAASATPTPALRGGPFVSLHAVRTSQYPQNNILAFDHTGADAAAIAMLYGAIVALKPFPPGPINCPADLGVLYHLTFMRADGTQLTGEAKPDGCEYASLNGGAHGMIITYDAFWPLFVAALGIQARDLNLTQP